MRSGNLFRATCLAGVGLWLSAALAQAAIVGDWRFDEATSGYAGTVPGSIVDSSGNGLDGYGVGATPPEYVPGAAYDNNIAALHFTTADDEVWIPDYPALTFADGASFTIEAIVRSAVDGDTNTRGIVVKRHVTNVDGGFWLRAYSGHLNVSVGDINGRVTLDGTTPIMNQRWHHVALVYDAVGETLSLYVDHKLDAAPVPAVLGEIVTVDPTNTPVIIGGWITADANRQWNGDIDMVRISTGVLTPGEFVQLDAGACCQNDGSCSLTQDFACTGTWYGPGTDCGTVNCPILGSCCHLDGSCAVTTEAACDGHWGGPGTSCEASTCLGSCVFDTGGCSDTTAAGCSGTWGGYGTSCATTSDMGACCLPDGTCSQTTAANCQGEWHGPGTTCGSIVCTGACCDGGCTETTQNGCANGWQGSGSHCTQACPPGATVGFWTFNESPAGTLASSAPGFVLDVSGNNHPATAAGVSVPIYAAGDPQFTNDTSLRFSAAPGGLTVPNSPALDLAVGESLTVEAVVRNLDPTRSRYILQRRPGTGTVRPGYWFRAVKLANLPYPVIEGIIIGTTGNDRAQGTTNIADGLWHHVAMVYDFGATPEPTIAVYVDYQLDGVVPCKCSGSAPNYCGAIESEVDAFLATAGNDANNTWVGDIDFIKMTKAALTPTQFVRPQVPTLGACCMSDGSCAITTLEGCSGHWQGPNTTCELVSCPLPGACCLGDGSCVITLESDCPGTFFGPGTTCGDVNCTGACCQFDGSCVEVGPASCVGQWRGLGTHCGDQTCVALGDVIGYWKFDEATSGNAGTAPGSIIDSSTNALHGAALGSPPPAYVPGSNLYVNGAALDFTVASGDAVVIPDHPLMDFNDGVGFTVEALIRTSFQTGTRYIAFKRDLSGTQPPARPAFYLRTIPTTVNGLDIVALDANLHDAKGGNTTITGTIDVADGNWHHVAMAYDAIEHTITLYVDYQVDVSDVCFRSDLSNAAPFYIGNTYTVNSGAVWKGDMDFVRVSLGAIPPSAFVQRRKSPDFDFSGMVDGTDLAFFMNCVTGPDVTPPTTGCEPADLDYDDDVDQVDFGRFQRCYGGPVTDDCLN